MRLLGLLAVLALAACGVDGEPKPKGPGAGIGGEVRIGVSGTL